METVGGIDPATGEGRKVTIAADGTIASVEPDDAAYELYLAAGLVDLQINGYRGVDLNSGRLTAAAVSELSRILLRGGVTRYLPTVVTASREAILGALAAIAQAVEADPVSAAMIAGIHVEGPFISPEDGFRGAHPVEHVRPPDLDEVDAWQAASGGRVRLMTVSPHWSGSEGFVRGLVRRGILVALGHTDASHAQIAAAVDAGASLSTHLGNGAAATLPRHPNVIWSQLADHRLSASLIADGHHLPAEVLRVMLRAKGLERSILVSDAAALGGTAPGVHEQPIGGRVEVTADGRLVVAGTPYLAGAWRGLSECVALATVAAGLSLEEALRLASDNPARFIGDGPGLSVGSRADLILFGHEPGQADLRVEKVWLAGRRVV